MIAIADDDSSLRVCERRDHGAWLDAHVDYDTLRNELRQGMLLISVVFEFLLRAACSKTKQRCCITDAASTMLHHSYAVCLMRPLSLGRNRPCWQV
jgi:hypothetical protein